MSLNDKKSELRRKRQDLRDRLKERAADSRSKRDAGPGRDRGDPAVFLCVRCSGSIRLGVPTPAELFRCPRCRQAYRVSTVRTDPLVVLLVPEVTAGGQGSDARSGSEVPEHIKAAFAVLGMDPTDDLSSVRREYRQLVRQYHPDKVATLGAELRRVAESKTRDLNRAFEVIDDFLSAPKGPERS